MNYKMQAVIACGVKLEIEHDQMVGFYLYVYDLKSGLCLADYLYDNLEGAFNKAAILYNIKEQDFVQT
jgi:hypothetical protein